MTIADFLYQAGFWQWIGMIVLAGIIASGIANARLWGDVTTNKTKNIYAGKKEDA